ncbi:hypothetical protein IEQ34_022327 [Dendrobium chrysotoxum]|uniref:Uncharacterized protein n=1 Tax=Dendrobium chrysotoxum TaxID=161865 RepID=A0AAV7FXD9_DENCH|nr:hypothetical protein IEQ34_022327 [Dendrobium chrysotoxum]
MAGPSVLTSSTSLEAAAPLRNVLAPMSLLLHCDALKSHLPFHFSGGGGMPSPLKEGWSGKMPVSRTPITTPSPPPNPFQPALLELF